MTRSFHWKPEKNKWLLKERGACFEDIEAAIFSGYLKGIMMHPLILYQRIFVVDFREMVWAVPFSEAGGFIFLRTAYPSRKLRKVLEAEREHE